MPQTVSFGQSFRFAPDLLLALDILFPRDNDSYMAFGAEFSRPVKKDLSASLRVGYSTLNSGSGLGGLAGLSAGAGFSFPYVRVDYAWVPFGLLGNTHRFTLSFRF